ncbi:MAG: hypothetical protein E6I75_10620 [Chloroflexi bacterium]|nr:MAG: hypothetical protein E6I75_10620 [Chloroflexota bacterium]
MASRIGPILLPEPGHKQSGYFTFDDPLLGEYQWPYFAVVGPEPGLTFLLTAGIHAAEYTGTLAALRLGQHVQPEHVRGTIIIIPLLNRPGFFERSIYTNPEDGQNLNRAFPGKVDGTWSERFAHHLLNDVVVHVDRAMDLHAGDMVEDLEPFLGYFATGDRKIDDSLAASGRACCTVPRPNRACQPSWPSRAAAVCRSKGISSVTWTAC